MEDQLFPEADEPNSTGSTLPHNPVVVSSVWLPDEVRRYQFFYNVYGELTRVVLPTDGAIEYDMAPGSGIVCGAGGTCGYGDDLQIYRRVKERRIYAGSSAAAPLQQKTTYSTVEGANGASSTIKVEHLNSVGVVVARSRHLFNGSAMYSLFPGAVTAPYGVWFEGREQQTEVLNTAGAFDTATVLRRVVNTWAQRAPVAWWPAYASSVGLDVTKEPPQDPRLTSTVTTIEPASANLVTKQTFAYDRYNNRTDTFEYDFGTGSAPLYPVRHSQTTFITTRERPGLRLRSNHNVQ